MAARRHGACSTHTLVGVADDDREQRIRQLKEFVSIDSDAEGRVWRPDATSMEALVLKVLGSWETLKSDVNWAYFHSAGPSGPLAKSKELPATIRKVAEMYNVRWADEKWSAECAKANQVRQKLAHLLYVYKVDNESPAPNRKLAFMRLGRPGEPRTVDGRPAELQFRDSVYSQQARHVDLVTEQELIEALDAIKWLVDCCKYLDRLGWIHRLTYGWPDDHVLPKWERDRLAWWFDDWGDPPNLLNFRQRSIAGGVSGLRRSVGRDVRWGRLTLGHRVPTVRGYHRGLTVVPQRVVRGYHRWSYLLTKKWYSSTAFGAGPAASPQ